MSDFLRLAFVVALIAALVIAWDEAAKRRDTLPAPLPARVDTIIRTVPEIRTVTRRQIQYQQETTFVALPSTQKDTARVTIDPDTMVFGVFVAGGDTTPTLVHPLVVHHVARLAAANDSLGVAVGQLDSAVTGLQQARVADRARAQVAVQNGVRRGRLHGFITGVVMIVATAWAVK